MGTAVRNLRRAACAVLALGMPGRVVAQTTLIGIVADTAKRPLQGVEVRALKSGLTASSDAQGIFVIAGLPQGAEDFVLRRIGFKGQSFSADIAGNDTVRIGVILEPAAQLLPDVTIEARGRTYRGLMAGFADRMLHSGAPPSSFVTREDIEKWGKQRVVDIMQQAGLNTVLGANGVREPRCPRGYTGLPQRPVIYLNGARTIGQFDFDAMHPDQVEAMEVYKSPMEMPSEFNRDAACVVVIWTRGAGGRD